MNQIAPSLFPPAEDADSEGLLCEGGDFDVSRLLAAYRQGIFPWGGDPVRWFCPDPRSIFWEIHIARKVKRLFRSGRFRVTADQAFRAVVEACRSSHGEDAAWITSSYIETYTLLHRQGIAHSIEVWEDDTLVGGLYGVQIGSYFAGESMFYRVSNASKLAFFVLCRHLWDLGIVLFDSQVINYHTHALGAALVAREDFLRMLEYAVELPPIGENELGTTNAHRALWVLSSHEALNDGGQAQDRRQRFWTFNDERDMQERDISSHIAYRDAKPT